MIQVMLGMRCNARCTACRAFFHSRRIDSGSVSPEPLPTPIKTEAHEPENSTPEQNGDCHAVPPRDVTAMVLEQCHQEQCEHGDSVHKRPGEPECVSTACAFSFGHSFSKAASRTSERDAVASRLPEE